MGNVYIGTSGYNYKEWKGDFYPITLRHKKWLEYYASQFSTLEVNATFYRSFTASVYQKWYQTTGDNFRFVLKGPRLITHIKRLKNIDDEMGYFFDTNASLGHKLACILWQFPSNFHFSQEKLELLEHVLKQLPKTVRHAIEIRHASWLNDAFYTRLHDYNTNFVINDSSQFPSATVTTADFVYVRFHGPKELYASSYTKEELIDWSEQMHNWVKDRDIYGYFNNDMGGHAFRNAKELESLLNK